MTTRVAIINFGPMPVTVTSVFGDNITPGEPVVVQPGEVFAGAKYIYPGVSFRIDEKLPS